MADGGSREEPMLLGRGSNDSWTSQASSAIESDVEMADLEDASFRAYQSSIRPKWMRRSRANSKAGKRSSQQLEYLRPRRKRSRYHQSWRLAFRLPYLLFALLLVTGVFFPSYTTAPQRYIDLRQRVLSAIRPGAANPNNEKVFIAASLYDNDGNLLRGDWGRSVLHLVDALGPDNVFVSVFENDASEEAMRAISDFRQRLPCQSSVVYDELDTSNLYHVRTTDGEDHLKRIAFLAEIRNRALRPLDDETSEAYNTTWDKLLYLNDIAFDPIDAANLLLSTNVDEATGRTDYRAACAVDFINPFKFYDTFATRDREGYSMGVPFYPWFTGSGKGESRADVLAQKDAVRVKSCWGGMVAFEGKWFQQARSLTSNPASANVAQSSPPSATGQDAEQPSPSSHDILVRSQSSPSSASTATNNITTPLRFRSSPEAFWDASECCLIHADLAATADSQDAGIYINPFVRVAYDRSTLLWLPFTRRFERLYSPVQGLINRFALRPGGNARQFEHPGQVVRHRVWQWTGNGNGEWREERVVAAPGGFCGIAKSLFIQESRKGGRGEGAHWGSEDPPVGL